MSRSRQINPRASAIWPPSFLVLCLEAIQRGEAAYQEAGHVLLECISSLSGSGLGEAAWSKVLLELKSSIQSKNDQAILALLDWWFPVCMATVPRRGRRPLLAAVYRYSGGLFDSQEDQR